jgi:hypothetical protein
MGSFEERQILAKEDLAIIQALSLKYRGHNQWPLFRSYEPGFYPWFLEASQCRFLTRIFTQALNVSLRKRGNPKILGDPSQYHYLIRKPNSERIPLKQAEQLPLMQEVRKGMAGLMEC